MLFYQTKPPLVNQKVRKQHIFLQNPVITTCFPPIRFNNLGTQWKSRLVGTPSTIQNPASIICPPPSDFCPHLPFRANSREFVVNLFNFFLNPVFQFFKLYILKRGFLDGMPGFIISVLSSYYTFLKYVKLWEIRNIEL